MGSWAQIVFMQGVSLAEGLEKGCLPGIEDNCSSGTAQSASNVEIQL